jgi:UDP-2-acetamido-3-amino-2,3-dideoxy-glucuronate N-acetyltransferase
MISSTAIIDKGATIGDNTSIWHFTHIRSTVVIGDNSTVGSHCYIDSDVSIGNDCKVQSGCLIYHPAKIGNGVFIGPGVRIINDKNPRAVKKNGERITDDDWICEGVIIEDYVSIGTGSIIMPGVTVGEGSVIGAGSTVTKNIPPKSVIYGEYAKPR